MSSKVDYSDLTAPEKPVKPRPGASHAEMGRYEDELEKFEAFHRAHPNAALERLNRYNEAQEAERQAKAHAEFVTSDPDGLVPMRTTAGGLTFVKPGSIERLTPKQFENGYNQTHCVFASGETAMLRGSPAEIQAKVGNGDAAQTELDRIKSIKSPAERVAAFREWEKGQSR